MTEDRFIRMKELTAVVGLSKSTIYKLIIDNKFPQQVKVTQRTSAWRLSTIMNWMDGRAAANK